MRILFGDYVLDPERRELTRGLEAIAVGPQVFDLLLYLVQNREHVVSKDALLDVVWGGRIVSEFNVDQSHQCGAQGNRRQRWRTAADPDDCPQGIPVRRRRQGDTAGRSFHVGEDRPRWIEPPACRGRSPFPTSPRLGDISGQSVSKAPSTGVDQLPGDAHAVRRLAISLPCRIG